MHRLAVAVLALASGACLREKIAYCNNGAYCPDPLVCTERTEEPFCGRQGEVEVCLGMPDETPCTITPGDVKGYCSTGICTPCDPNLAFCKYEQWTRMPVVLDGSVLATELSSIWAASPTDVYVVGRTGTAVRWNGRSWSRIPSVATDSDFESIDGLGATEIYATTAAPANGSRVHRFDGVGWSAQMPAPVGIMYSVTADANRAFVVGANGEIGNYTGTWSFSTQGGSTFFGVWADATTAVAVGNAGAAVRYTTGWSPDPTGTNYILRDVAGADAVEFAVGRAPIKAPVVVRHAAGAWSDMTSMLPAVTGSPELLGVWAATPTDVYAVGEGGTILHYDGTAWTAMQSSVATLLTEVYGTSTDVFAIGAGGTVLRLSR